MSSRLGIAVAGLVAVAGIGGAAPPQVRRQYVLDLGRGPTPRVEIDGVERPVVAFGPSGGTQVASGGGPVPARGLLDTPAILPEAWTVDGVQANALILVDGTARNAPAMLVHGSPPHAVTRFQPAEIGKPAQWAIFVVALPRHGAQRRSFGPLVVHAGARLRMSVGIPPEACKVAPPAIVRVDVVDHGRARVAARRRVDPATDCNRWTPVDVPLASSDGRPVRLRFQLRAADPADRERTLAVAIGDPIVASPEAGPPRPNVILISLDTLGAKHLSGYGYPYPTSPHMDAFARRATVFEHAVAHYPTTGASHMSLFTSRVVATHGVRGYLDVLPASIDTVPQAFRRAGYVTAAFTEDGLVSRRLGFARGFHHFHEDPSPVEANQRGAARATFGAAARWIGRQSDGPFFLFVHTYEVHGPYRPSPGHAAAVRPPDLPAPVPDPARLYDAEIHGVDEIVARFLRVLRLAGVADDTIVVITADHGEAFGEHGHRGHGRCLHEEVMHVPLLVAGPGVTAGQRVPTRVGLVDVAPTLLDLAGVSPMASAEGRSLAPALRGQALAPRPVVAEVRGPLGPNGRKPWPDQRTVWVGDAKMIHDETTGEFWFSDVARDPDENRAALPSLPTFGVMKRSLDAYERLRPPVGGAAPGEALATPDVVERMRALGYVE